jgi:hypothetical protein
MTMWLKCLIAAAAFLLTAILFAANKPALPNAYYSGKLADGRALQLLLRGSGQDRSAFVQIEGIPYSSTLALKTNTARRITYGGGVQGDTERWPINSLDLTPTGLPSNVTSSSF